MKKVKYLICFLLITVGFLFNGEIFILYLDSFQESYYRSSFDFENLPIGFIEEDIIEDFINIGTENDVDFFMVNSKIESTYHKIIKIYGTEEAIQDIERKGIKAKEYNSLFLGKVDVRFEKFEDIQDITGVEYCYYIGEKDDKGKLDSFKSGLIDTYGGGFPRCYGSNKETKLNIFTVWLSVISIILILTIYDIAFQKKEVAVRVILGEEPKMILLKNLYYDTGFLLISFIIISVSLRNISNTYFYIEDVTILFFLLIIINTLINTTILRVDFKKSCTKNTGGNNLLLMSYGQKTIVTIFVIIILSSNLIVISDGINYYKQRSFFKEHENSSYYRLNYKVSNKRMTIEDEAIMNLEFYNKFQSEALLYSDLSKNFDAGYPIVLINRNAMKLLSNDWSFLTEIKDIAGGESYYILVPDNISLSSSAFQSAKKNVSMLTDDEVRVVRYEDYIEMVGVENQVHFKSQFFKKPIIIYENTLPDINTRTAENFMYMAYNVMYDVSDKDFLEFANEHELENQIVVKSNVMDVYDYNWNIIFRNMRITFLLSIFFVVLEIALVIFIIQMEYKFNAVEMALKKIYGYTIFERNKRFVVVTMISSIISLIAGWLLLFFSDIQRSFAILWGVPLLFAIELIFINKKAMLIEVQKIPVILKGERG